MRRRWVSLEGHLIHRIVERVKGISWKRHFKPKLATSLLLLRVGIFIVFLFWGLDKILVPEHATKVLSGFYGIDISDNAIMAMGVAQLGFLGAFVVGMWKKYTYGAILVLHAGSTFASLEIHGPVQ